MTCDVAAWLRSPAGVKWSRRHCHHDATYYHDMIEIKNDLCHDEIADHMWICTDSMFKMLRMMPGWHDVPWTPDRPPERW